MECKVYGHGGRPMLYIPCQDGRFFDFENFHMADTLAPWIESGQLMVMSIDTLDKETWSDTNGDPYWRIRRYEQWLHYIVDEAVPSCAICPRSATAGMTCRRHRLWLQPRRDHAVNLYLRWPDIFCGCLALSGIYTAHYGFGDYMDELVYMNSPVDYMRNFPRITPIWSCTGTRRLSSAAVRRMGAARHHLDAQAHLRGKEHPCLGGPVGPRRQARLGLVV